MTSGPAGNITFLVSQLINQGPILFVYLVAGYFSIIYMSRARLPSTLTLIGVMILLATIFGQSAVHAYLASNRTSVSFPELTQITIVAGSCLRAVGLGFLVAAIFVGRNETSGERYLRE